MIGISSSGKDRIHDVVEDLFDKIALELLGRLPSLKRKKFLAITSQKNLSLPTLFIQSMYNKTPNELEKDALKGMLTSSYTYIEALKNRTKANLSESLDAVAKDIQNGNSIAPEAIQDIIAQELDRAKSHMVKIAEAQTTKVRNVGGSLEIAKVAGSIGDEDPSVFFVVVRDARTCEECIKVHLLPDGTPKVWKLSEVSHAFHKRGEDKPSTCGLHPFCRCFLTYLSKDYGFKDGKIAYIKQGHNEYSRQNPAK